MDTERSETNNPQDGSESYGTEPHAGTPQSPQGAPQGQQPPAPPQHDYRAPQHDMHVPPRPPLPAYSAPQAPQPQFTAPNPSYAQQHHAGQAFGPAATQPTQPLFEHHLAPAGATQKAPRKKGAGRVAALLVAAALVGGAAGVGGSALQDQLSANAGTPSSQSGPSSITVNNPGSVNEATAVATQVLPSVVTIDVSGENQAGSGSGVILSDDGYVVTNTHVVTLGGATADPSIRVTTSDGRIYDAEVVGTDPTYDLAVIKLKDASDLTPIEFADSSKLNVGDTTAAVGAPLGLSNTVTTGIVSALNRSIEIASSAAPDSGDQTEPGPDEEDSPFRFDNGQPQQQATPSLSISIAVIQTDAAINHGNSGGALVDSKGRLIGINVAIASTGSSSGSQSGSIGVGFSTPSALAQRVAQEIIANGEATHGLLGATVRTATSDDSDVVGAVIEDVTSGGAADQAGLKKGDVVTRFNGVAIASSTDLTAQVRALASGSTAKLSYQRGGQAATAEVKLGELKA